MEWFAVPKEEPSIIFPVGAILEDNKGTYKVLSFEKQDNLIHKYKVEVLQQKDPIPKHFKPFLDEKFQMLVVLPQNLHLIRRIQ